MAKKSQTPAANAAADPAETAGQDQTAASASALAAETSSDGTAETTSAVDGAGEADAQPQPISSADSVSTSAGGEAASSDVASNDTQSEQPQPDPAAPAVEAAASAEVAAGDEDVFLFGGADEAPELMLGLPPMVEIRDGHIPRAIIFAEVRRVLGLDGEDDDQAWSDLPEDKRSAAVAIGLSAMRSSAAAAAQIQAIFAPAPEGLIEITAKSSDGQPFNRGGVRWDGDYRTVVVDQEVYDRLVADPNLTVKA